jgi:hypothetical protein
MSKLPYIKPQSLSLEMDVNQSLLSNSIDPNSIIIGRGITNPTDITPQAKSFNMEYWDEDEEGY